MKHVLTAALCLASPLVAQSFTVIGLPDTQKYSEYFPHVFTSQTDWIVAQFDALDIRYVAHYGDVVQHADSLNEWDNADGSMAALDALGIAYGVTAGNHDVTPNGVSGEAYTPGNYQSYFGFTRFTGKTWYRGTSPSGMSNYQVFAAAGQLFLALHLEVDCPLSELVWAQDVLDQNRDKPVLMTTHRYLQDAEDYTAGVPLVPSGRYPAIWYTAEGLYTPNGTESENTWSWFIRKNPGIFLVNCGHFHEEYRQTSTNAYGNPVHEVLADYQDDPSGGNGWLRVMEFDLAANLIDVDSYSPWLDQQRFTDESDFVLDVDFARYHEERPSVVLQEGIGGYAETVDTWVNEASPNTSYGDDSERVSDDDTTNSFFSDSQGQALVRFDGLVDGAALGRIPLGATIVSAHLSLEISDDIDNPLFDPNFEVRRVLVPWDEDSTWNSLSGGLSGSELTGVLASFTGDNSPNGDGLRRLEVTSAVQAWADGAPNFGFAIVPEVISGNDDGIALLTSESPNPLLRPRLEVVWDLPGCDFLPYGLSATPQHTLELTAGGRASVGGTVELLIAEVPTTFTYVAVANGPATLPFQGGLILVDPSQLSTLETLPVFGELATKVIPVPAIASLAGQSFFAQAVSIDFEGTPAWVFSNGVEVALCQ